LRPWVLVNEPIKQRIDNLPHGPGSSAARPIRKPSGDLQPLTLLEACAPLKDRALTHSPPLGHFAGALPLLTPQQGLRTAQGLRIQRVGGYLFHAPPRSLGETPSRVHCSLAPYLLERCLMIPMKELFRSYLAA